MKKRFVTSFLAILMCLSALPSHAFALNTGSIGLIEPNRTITEEDIFVTAEEAGYIAQSFINDTIEAQLSNWDSSTLITNIVTMYDQTDEAQITAYTVELTSGYIVVSAYLGIDTLILEWSDEAAPIYSEFDMNSTDRIVYVGNLSYYKDSGERMLEAPDGTQIQRHEIYNVLESARDVQNVPDKVVSAILEAPSVTASPLSDPVITAPRDHAHEIAQGPFVYYEHINKWDSSEKQLTLIHTGEFPNYRNHCGPTAVTNMLRMYGNRENISAIKSKSNTELFEKTIYVGSGLYYFNLNIQLGTITIGGTFDSSAGAFIRSSFEEFGLTSNSVRKNISYDNIKSSLSKDCLLYLILKNHNIYSNHHLVCYAYSRMVSQTTGYFITYLKVADGWSTSPRHICLSSALTDTYWEATIHKI